MNYKELLKMIESTKDFDEDMCRQFPITASVHIKYLGIFLERMIKEKMDD